MAIAANAADAFSGGSAGAKATSATATIPSGAGIGDTLFLVFTASSGPSSAAAPAMPVSVRRAAVRNLTAAPAGGRVG